MKTLDGSPKEIVESARLEGVIRTNLKGLGYGE